jgi:TRAP transporter TAXI family solute receptor
MQIKTWLITVAMIVAVLATACGGNKATPSPTATPTTTATPTASPSPTPISKPAAEKTLIMGAVPSTSSTYPFFVSLGQIINDAIPEILFVVKDSVGTEAVMNGLINKDYAFGESIASVEFAAYSGLAPWDTEQTDLRRLFSWSTQIMTITVTEASGIQSIADLDGKKLMAGITGSWPEAATKQILGALGVNPDYQPGPLTDVTSEMKDGKIDGFVKYVQPDSPDASITDVQNATSVRLLSFTPEDIQKVTAKYPSLTTGTIKSGVYQNVDEINSFTVVATVATFKDYLSEEEAYKIVKAVWEGKDILGAAYAPFKGYNLPEETIATSLIPLHAGAYEYFKDLGLTVPDQIIPPEAKP